MSRRSTAFAQAAGEPNPLRWHVAVTNPGWEVSVQRQLQARGIDTVVPMIRFWRVRHRRRVAVERPLLPRYVLFGMDPEEHNLLNIVGLERIARRADERWAVIDPETVYDLRFRLLRGEFDPTLAPVSPLVRWLVENGELRPDDVLTHKQAKTKGLIFEVAA